MSGKKLSGNLAKINLLSGPPVARISEIARNWTSPSSEVKDQLHSLLMNTKGRARSLVVNMLTRESKVNDNRMNNGFLRGSSSQLNGSRRCFSTSVAMSRVNHEPSSPTLLSQPRPKLLHTRSAHSFRAAGDIATMIRNDIIPLDQRTRNRISFAKMRSYVEKQVNPKRSSSASGERNRSRPQLRAQTVTRCMQQRPVMQDGIAPNEQTNSDNVFTARCGGASQRAKTQTLKMDESIAASKKQAAVAATAGRYFSRMASDRVADPAVDTGKKCEKSLTPIFNNEQKQAQNFHMKPFLIHIFPNPEKSNIQPIDNETKKLVAKSVLKTPATLDDQSNGIDNHVGSHDKLDLRKPETTELNAVVNQGKRQVQYRPLETRKQMLINLDCERCKTKHRADTKSGQTEASFAKTEQREVHMTEDMGTTVQHSNNPGQSFTKNVDIGGEMDTGETFDRKCTPVQDENKTNAKVQIEEQKFAVARAPGGQHDPEVPANKVTITNGTWRDIFIFGIPNKIAAHDTGNATTVCGAPDNKEEIVRYPEAKKSDRLARNLQAFRGAKMSGEGNQGFKMHKPYKETPKIEYGVFSNNNELPAQGSETPKSETLDIATTSRGVCDAFSKGRKGPALDQPATSVVASILPTISRYNRCGFISRNK